MASEYSRVGVSHHRSWIGDSRCPEVEQIIEWGFARPSRNRGIFAVQPRQAIQAAVGGGELPRHPGARGLVRDVTGGPIFFLLCVGDPL